MTSKAVEPAEELQRDEALQGDDTLGLLRASAGRRHLVGLLLDPQQGDLQLADSPNAGRCQDLSHCPLHELGPVPLLWPCTRCHSSSPRRELIAHEGWPMSSALV
eukprot:1515261-Alexandrium_andersonii.AAC.1